MKLMLALLIACVVALCSRAHVRAAEPGHPVEGAPAQAHRLIHPIALDGKLDESDWVSAPVLDQLVEVYLRERQGEERFLDTFRRTGVSPFTRIKAAPHSA